MLIKFCNFHFAAEDFKKLFIPVGEDQLTRVRLDGTRPYRLVVIQERSGLIILIQLL